jgi:hypothetical protein
MIEYKDKSILNFFYFQPLFNDDDDNLWEMDNEDDEEEEKLKSTEDKHIVEQSSICKQKPSSPSIILFPSPRVRSPSSSTIIVKKAPLKLVIKRLQHPTISTEIKYKLHTVNTSLPVTT